MTPYTELVDRYIAVWNEPDGARRRDLIAQTWTTGATYVDPLMQSEGHDGIDSMVQSVQDRFPGYRFHRTGSVDAVQNSVRFSWSFAPDGGDPFAAGTDFGVVAPDNRLQSVTGFFDLTPTCR